MISYFAKLAENLESYLFYEDATIEDFQFRAFMNNFNDNHTIPLKFLQYLHREIKSSLALNASLAVLNSFLIPYCFWSFVESSSCLTLWLSILTLLNWAIIWPKLILNFRINKIIAIEDTLTNGYQIWTLLRSKLYKFNNRTSKCIFCTYIAGFLLIWFCKGACSHLFWSCAFYLLFFIFRLVISYIKFNNTFSNCQNVDMLFEYLEGNAPEKISSLKIQEYKELQSDSKLSEQKSCPICYENYTSECLVKVTECPGKHVFHQQCIDCWLIKSEKCPMCNCSVFHERQSKDGKVKKE